jgi:predicted nuclease of predicted toxin-antitoxin system
VRFLIDENVPLVVAKALRQLGHECFVVAEQSPSAVDPDLLAQARAEQRILVTFDSDFSRLIFRELRPTPPGVVYMQSRPEHATLVGERFLSLFRDGSLDPISRFIVIDLGGVRSIPLQ